MNVDPSTRVEFTNSLPATPPSPDIQLVRDETASEDLASVLPPQTRRYLIHREQLDPRWEWVEVTELDSAEPQYVKGRCRHLEVEPVETGSGVDDIEVVAHLCRTCDAQLPAEWKP